MNRREFLSGTALAASTVLLSSRAQAKAQQPNILMIMADDMGWADVQCFGSRHIRTPEIDRLATSGVRLTDAYANSPVCSPSRLAIHTGRYNARFRTGLVEPFSAGPWGDQAIPAGQPTLPGELRKAGYRTSLIGKWHLGETPAGGPLAHGYDRFFGFLGGGIDYFTHEYRDKKALWQGDKPTERNGYLTTILADEAIKEMRESAGASTPFYMSLYFNAPHWPWEGPEDSQLGTKRGQHDFGDTATYGRMVESLDMNIGRVLTALETLGLAENTLVIFTSDNGGERFSEVWPFRSEKGFLLEGGIRVPTIVRFPGRLPRGTSSAQMAAGMDWMPTMLEAAGVPKQRWPELDGVSLLDALASEHVFDRTLYWKFQGHNQRAARRGKWKYYQLGDQQFLYDLSIDPLERANRAKAEPAILTALATGWVEWNKGMVTDPTIQGFCTQPQNVGIPYRTGPEENCKATGDG